LAFEGAVTTTNAVGEGSYWINYQRRFSEERWWMSSGKTSTPQGTIIDTPDGPVISETDALKRLGIN
jgi:hypothetical protein